MVHRLLFPLIVWLAAAAPGSATADWINLTGAETAPNIAEIHLLDDRVKLNLEIYVGDLRTFEELVPDDLLKDASGRPSPVDRIRRFAEERFQFVTDAGQKLPARIDLVEPRMRVDRKSPFAGMINPATRQRVPEGPADKRVLYAEISYPFADRPAALTIVPPLDEQGRARVTMGFIAYHKAVPITDFRYLGTPARLTLDWDDPWYTKFDNPNLKRHHKSALMSFLYVEPYEVRHEILTRVRDLEEWMDLGLRGDRYIEVDELEPLKQRIGEFLLTRNPVLVDGQALKPILDRTNYVKVSLTGIQLVEKPERLEIATAIIGVIISYITEGMPGEVTVDWELFTDQIVRVPATATDPAGPLPTVLTPDYNVHSWKNFLKNYKVPTVESVAVAGSLGTFRVPWATIVCLVLALPVAWWLFGRRRQGRSIAVPVGVLAMLVMGGAVSYPLVGVSVLRPAAIAGSLQPDQARELLRVLLKNVYRAFDFREEEDVYERLVISVSGDLLADIYLQNRRSFSIQKAGGAQAKIDSVDIQEAVAERLDDRPLGYAIRGRWAAQGSVGHWGHIHSRRNQYDAVVTVEAVDGAWKITDLEVLGEQRVDPTFGAGPTTSSASDAPSSAAVR